MSSTAPSPTILCDSQVAIELAVAVHLGQVAEIERLLAEHRDLARTTVVDHKGGGKSALHFVTDWPGYFPRGPEIARLLLAAGADPDAVTTPGSITETPLHWAASSDDVDVALVLVDGGANLEASGGSIAGGTPLTNAVAYGCWDVARLLVARGANVRSLWEAAALGLTARVDELLSSDPTPTQDDLDEAFWHACNGGQRRMAAHLHERGARLDGAPDYAGGSPPVGAAANLETRRELLVEWLNGLLAARDES